MVRLLVAFLAWAMIAAVLIRCDALDGHIDNPSNCCEAITSDRVERCLERHTEPMHCKVAECPTFTVFACRHPDGGLADGWTGAD